MIIKNIFTELQNAPIDASANIRVIQLTGDATLAVFAAEISPKTALKPHYHSVGIETYQILQGEGIMKVGVVQNGTVVWNESFATKTGDCFTIPEGNVHQIINESEDTLLAIFSCPENHLSSDRFFVGE